jgi:hypothetical protein
LEYLRGNIYCKDTSSTEYVQDSFERQLMVSLCTVRTGSLLHWWVNIKCLGRTWSEEGLWSKKLRNVGVCASSSVLLWCWLIEEVRYIVSVCSWLQCRCWESHCLCSPTFHWNLLYW